LGQEIFLRSPSTKTTEFEVKNRYKSVEEAKQTEFDLVGSYQRHLKWYLQLLLLIFRVVKRIYRFETNSSKVY